MGHAGWLWVGYDPVFDSEATYFSLKRAFKNCRLRSPTNMATASTGSTKSQPLFADAIQNFWPASAATLHPMDDLGPLCQRP